MIEPAARDVSPRMGLLAPLVASTRARPCPPPAYTMVPSSIQATAWFVRLPSSARVMEPPPSTGTFLIRPSTVR
jgi:hypothetical protein